MEETLAVSLFDCRRSKGGDSQALEAVCVWHWREDACLCVGNPHSSYWESPHCSHRMTALVSGDHCFPSLHLSLKTADVGVSGVSGG